MAIVHEQAGGATSSSVTTINSASGVALKNNSILIVAATSTNFSNTLTIFDSIGNTYTNFNSMPLVNQSSTGVIRVAWARNTTVSTNTFSLSQSLTTNIGFSWCEISGLDTTPSFIGAQLTGTANTSTISIGPVSNSVANAILLCIGCEPGDTGDGRSVGSVPSGMLLSTDNRILIEYKILSALESNTPQINLQYAGPGSWAGIALVLQEVAPVFPPPPFLDRQGHRPLIAKNQYSKPDRLFRIGR
jgi:hypothetical protein